MNTKYSNAGQSMGMIALFLLFLVLTMGYVASLF